jgi:hypothetical protein
MKNHWLRKEILRTLSEELMEFYRGRDYDSLDALLAERHVLLPQLASWKRIQKLKIIGINTQFKIEYDPPSYWVKSLKIEEIT